jgi:DNA adenine methylase
LALRTTAETVAPTHVGDVEKEQRAGQIRKGCQRMKSPLCWMGGKSRLARKIIELIPQHEAYAEVFAGGAWVFFAKAESNCESINDLNSDLVVFYRVLQYHIEEFCRQFKFLLASREWFNDWNRQLAAGGLTDVQSGWLRLRVNS